MSQHYSWVLLTGTPRLFPELVLSLDLQFFFSLMLVTNTLAVGCYVLEAFLYGIYLILFGFTLCFLWKRRQYSTRRTMAVISGALCLLFILATIHMLMSLCILFLHVLTAPKMSSMLQYYGRGIVYLTLIGKCAFIGIMIVADSLLAWRGWVLWNRKPWIIRVFVLLEISLLVCATCHTFASLQSSKTSPNPVVVVWYMAFSFTSLSTNILASGLISFRLYQAESRITRVDGHVRAKRYRSLLWIYLESGSICPTMLIISFSLFFSDSPFWWLAITSTPQIAGMMPTFMVFAVLSAGYSLSESTTDSHWDTNSNACPLELQLRRGRNDNGRPATVEVPFQLTDLKAGSDIRTYEGFKTNGPAINPHEMT